MRGENGARGYTQDYGGAGWDTIEEEIEKIYE